MWPHYSAVLWSVSRIIICFTDYLRYQKLVLKQDVPVRVCRIGKFTAISEQVIPSLLMRSDIEVPTTVECAQAWERKCVYLILVNLDCIRSFKQSTYDQRRHKHPLVFVLYKCRVVTIFAKSYFSNYLFIKYGNCLLFSLSIYLSLSPPLCISLCWRHCYTHNCLVFYYESGPHILSASANHCKPTSQPTLRKWNSICL